MASIIVMSGKNKGDYYPLGRRTTVIGRAEPNVTGLGLEFIL